MEAGFIALLVIAMGFCIIIGVVIERSRIRRRDIQGVLNVDCSDSTYEPCLFLQLEVPIEEVVTKKQTTFIVHVIK